MRDDLFILALDGLLDEIAAAIYGDINPSGKLHSTFPRHLGQLPMDHGPANRS